jgi:type I restriction enzyme S subunit
MSHWVKKSLNAICVVDWGNTSLTKKAYEPSGQYLAVSAAGCDGRIGHAEHKAFTPVLSAIGAQCGKIFWPVEDFTAIKNTITLTPKVGESDSRFLFHLLEHIELPKRGAAQPFMSKGDISAFSVPVPPLPEQKRIAAILDAADALRAKRRESIEQLDSLVQATFLEMFGDPVTNPKGWESKRIEDFCKTQTGGTPSRSKASRYFGGSIPWVKSGELREQTIYDTEEHITPQALEESAAKMVAKGALMVALYGATVGRIARLGVEAATNQAICSIVLPANHVHPAYMFQALRTKVPEWLSRRVGGGQPNISNGVIKDTLIPLPPLVLQTRFASISEAIEQQKARLKAHLAELDTLFASLQSRAFNGELVA